ncbi:MAG TPA: PolC-type DNA polymerase III, partial [Bacilli bacterium]
MGNLAEKRNRFEMLMRQAEIPADIAQSFFAEGYIDKVICSRQNRKWTLAIRKETLIPKQIYITFCKLIQEKFAHIAQISFVIAYAEEVASGDIIMEYWPLMVAWAEREIPSINGWLGKAKLDCTNNRLRVELLDENIVEFARKKNIAAVIRRFYQQYFAREIRVELCAGAENAGQIAEFTKLIEQEERSAAIDALSKQAEQSEPSGGNRAVMLGLTIRDDAVPLMDIQEEEKKITIQGAVFGFEQKELRSGNKLFQFHVTDFTDSLSVKCFPRSKDDAKALEAIENGKWLKLRGKIEYDRFLSPPELVMIPNDINEITAPPERTDEAAEKRVEFHLHTTMSAMDAVTPVDEYIKTAAKWGHKAIAITDHGVVQAFPDANKAAKKYGIKVLYGLEANVVNDAVPIVLNAIPAKLDEAVYVVFDVETTGLSVTACNLIEIAGVKMQGGKIIDRFASFVNPHEKIPRHISQLTHITDEMVADAPDAATVVPDFLTFVGDAVLVAHNARFDIGFMQEYCRRLSLSPIANAVLDTLELARLLLPTLKNHRLNTLAERFKVELKSHHRAIDDAEALGHVLFHLIKEAQGKGIHDLERLNDYVGKDITNARPFHCCIYALNAAGKKNLYKLVSASHTEYFRKVPCIPKSVLAQMRDGLLISSGCDKGELFETVLNKSPEEAEAVAEFYDVLEIQPPSLYLHLVDKGLVAGVPALEAAVRNIVRIGKKLDKPVIATGNVHYLHPRDKIARDITIFGITGFHPLKEQRKPDVHLRTTEEMLAEFKFLGEETAYEVVVKATGELADRFETFEMFPTKGGPTDNGLFSPIIAGADEEIRSKCYEAAGQLYGDPLPEIVLARLEKELAPIIKYGFSANYLISERLVKKSNADGYLVGSRGSVGSSLVATLLGISEVNPLPPHYVCRNCRFSEWFADGSVPSGFDLPDKDCPRCKTRMKGDGQDIPFETFLGFKGDKVPDIDLNFSGEYQPIAHQYTKVLFGEKNVFRAGTIGTVAEKTAFGFVKKYEEEHMKKWRSAEVVRLANGCTGVKRSTGQHPGGIVVVPDYIDVEDITPVQYPADDTSSEWRTTHFDYHAFDSNLLKLDILGHDDPT